MKRFLFLVVAFMVMSVSSAEAWQVNIKNSCKHDVKISVLGNWCIGLPNIECTVDINAGEAGTCVLGENACPVEIIGDFKTKISDYRMEGVYCSAFKWCCCWNLNAEVVNYGSNSCVLQLR